MKYDTNNLDEAAYLALQGYAFTVTRTGQVSALFSFEADDRFNETRTRFWMDEATVQLHSWLATRTALKNECAAQKISAGRVASPSIVPAKCTAEAAVTPGSAYWYYEDTSIKHAVFANRPPHDSRLADGNFYRTKQSAQHKRDAMQVARST